MNELIPDTLTVVDLHYQGLAREIAHLREDNDKLFKLLNGVIQNQEDTTTSNIGAPRLYRALNIQDYLRMLTLGGYAVSYNFPRTSGLTSGNYPLSIYNTGQKTIIITSAHSITPGTASSPQINITNNDPRYDINGGAGGAIAVPVNRKVGVTAGPAISATYSTTAGGQTIPTTGDGSLVLEYGNQGQNTQFEFLTNEEIIVLPSKHGIVFWSVIGATAPVSIHVDLFELPF